MSNFGSTRWSTSPSKKMSKFNLEKTEIRNKAAARLTHLSRSCQFPIESTPCCSILFEFWIRLMVYKIEYIFSCTKFIYLNYDKSHLLPKKKINRYVIALKRLNSVKHQPRVSINCQNAHRSHRCTLMPFRIFGCFCCFTLHKEHLTYHI